MENGQDALQSVQGVLQSVQDDVKLKRIEIARLRELYSQLLKKSLESKELLHKTTQDLKVKDYALQESNQRNEELFRSLASEHDSFAHLKDEAEFASEKIEMLKLQNEEYTSRAQEEEAERDQLQLDISNLEKEVELLEDEKRKYKAVFKELEARLKVETDSFSLEEEQWKHKQMQLLSKFEAEDNLLANTQKKADDLSATTTRLTGRNAQIEGLLDQNEQQLEAMAAEYSESQQVVSALRSEHEQLASQNAELVEQNAKSASDLERSSDQLKVMAEKVFQLLRQLQRMDEWKVAFLEKQSEMEAKVHTLVNHCEELTDTLEASTQAKEEEEFSTKEASLKLQHSRKEALSVKREFLAMQKIKSVLKKKLQMKQSSLKQITTKATNVQSRLSTEQFQRDHERSILEALNTKVEEMEEHTQSLRAKIAVLELANTRHSSLLKKTDMQLDKYKEKDPYFAKLESTLSAKRDADAKSKFRTQDANTVDGFPLLKADVDTEEDIYKGETFLVRAAHLRLRRVLRGKGGEDVARMMKKMELNEPTLLEWTHDASKLVKGVYLLFTQLQEVKKVSRLAKTSTVQKANRIKGLATKNRELIGRLLTSEDHKTKGLIRLAAMLEATEMKRQIMCGQRKEGDYSRKKPLAGAHAGGGEGFFLTQGSQGAEEDEDTQNEDKERAQLLVSLSLSDNGVEDREVTLLSSALLTNSTCQEINLKANRVSTQGLLSLVDACLSEGNAVEFIDMQQNYVTLDGLEALAFMLLDRATGDASYPIPDPDPSLNKVRQTAATKAAEAKRKPFQLSAALKKEGEAVLPIVEVTLPSKKLTVDLRFNRLQRSADVGTTAGPSGGEEMTEALARITQVMKMCQSPSSAGALPDTEGKALFANWKHVQASADFGATTNWLEGANTFSSTAFSGDELAPEMVEADVSAGTAEEQTSTALITISPESAYKPVGAKELIARAKEQKRRSRRANAGQDAKPGSVNSTSSRHNSNPLTVRRSKKKANKENGGKKKKNTRPAASGTRSASKKRSELEAARRASK
mmetsp:Transcript_46794/g.92078  ORF Transcript_46794/g.92078 Transcript_46794/m.92078 type:complete len:1036 (+) Transcript_46794:57-3164(+)|eukprot:CAMPEP_0175130520 /NCGR_PEP_ID=MMETSP0087-20121206/6051_1 /TAXON_ID=136419 /ORGANISM="Unknown Unknown, Strain D1" /LENGTH=1035 /DNA_ID=CAMNT_0016412745 /DNA_START=47 /DNA_END=3154 /DNA_ORIENTATION=+